MTSGPNIDQNLYTPAIYFYSLDFGQREPVHTLGYATAIGIAMFAFTIYVTEGFSITAIRAGGRSDH